MYDINRTCVNFINRQGPNKWRDQLLPEDILNDWIKSKNFPEAQWSVDGDSVIIDGYKHSLEQSGEQ